MSLQEWFGLFLQAWIPLFVAIDPLGVAPLFLSLTQHESTLDRRRIADQATLTAAVIALAFVFLGELVFRALGITLSDFQIAGGLVLLGLAYRDLLGTSEFAVAKREDVGVVPLGTPLIAGPATLAMLLVLIKSTGLAVTLLALTANLLMVSLVFRHSDYIARVVGMRGLRAVSKIIALLLIAIAVNMIRRGLESMPPESLPF